MPATWTNVGPARIATLGPYEVRVTKRLKFNSRPIEWGVFKDGQLLRWPMVDNGPHDAKFNRFDDAKRVAEQYLAADVPASMQEVA